MNYDTLLSTKSKTKRVRFSFISLTLSVLILTIMVLILVSPVRYAFSVTNGLKLFFTAVLPGLLPFMFLCKLLTELGVISKLSKPLEKPMKSMFGVGGEGAYAMIISMLSGYPIGSKITADLYEKGKIKENELLKTALISSTSGPIFVIGAVGGAMLNSIKLGAIIYVSNILAVLTTSLIFHLFGKIKRKQKVKVSQTQSPTIEQKKPLSLYSLAKDTVVSLLIVGFYIALFSLIIDLLTDLKVIDFFAAMLGRTLGFFGIRGVNTAGIMSGIVEMTNGAKQLSSSISPLSVSFVGFLIAFSGISIITQSLSFLSKTPISAFKFVMGKFFQALVTFVFIFLFLLIFKI